MKENTKYKAGLYLRLSNDDMQQGESISIGTQRSMLTEYCQKNHYEIYKVYVDDGYSGMNFERPGLQESLYDIDCQHINMVITKDLSRLGRNYIMTGYYSEIYFAAKGVRYIAIGDGFDSLDGNNEIAPFKNILNEMYARDISKKIKSAKHQRAKQGFLVGTQAPYGYQIDPENKRRLIVDPDAAECVRLIFHLAKDGLGGIAIGQELKARKIVAPSVYKYLNGDTRFSRYPAVRRENYYTWCPATINQILTNRVYTGQLISLKTEVVNCKTKHKAPVPLEKQVVTLNAHEAIISTELFEEVQRIRSTHTCSANTRRFNLFRGKLFCECCGHPLIISKKQLKDREEDIYLCMHHYHRPEECPQTHRIYHNMLCSYVLQQIRLFAKSMKHRKINSKIVKYENLQELTPEILSEVIERIEIGHLTYKSKPGKVIQIYWKLN